ncbi:hypothetical protein [Thermoactinospora rubra]|uniref:hypothetical protein n=1 Tax=Thermoactinospora rubra TaxID=1088767 RepID=UPI000A111F7B|nr:hypothetical protein [Thermoactinospora rubra]
MTRATRLAVASLTRICRLVADGDRLFTLATGTDGHRFAAWPYGCIQLPRDLVRSWGTPIDGTYRLYGSGTIEAAELKGFGPELVVAEMLPRLALLTRHTVTATPWMYERDGYVRRLLVRDDGEQAIVDQELWRAWSSVLDLPAYQVGSKHGMVVWAPAVDVTAVAGLLPVYSPVALAPPEAAIA